jgi:hypothetical protein
MAQTPATAIPNANPGASSGAKPQAGESQPTQSATGTIKGTMTYYFNRNYGNKPDTGAQVWIVEPGVQIPEDCFFMGFSLMGISSQATIVQPDTRYKREVHVFAYTLADGSGNFTIANVPSGTYTLVMESAHTNGSIDGRATARDTPHRIVCWQVTVRPGATVDKSWDFGTTLF